MLANEIFTVGRPCQRCVNLGKQDTCVDVRHKKRGRPRLRDDLTVSPKLQAATSLPSNSDASRKISASSISSSSSSSSRSFSDSIVPTSASMRSPISFPYLPVSQPVSAIFASTYGSLDGNIRSDFASDARGHDTIQPQYDSQNDYFIVVDTVEGLPIAKISDAIRRIVPAVPLRLSHILRDEQVYLATERVIRARARAESESYISLLKQATLEELVRPIVGQHILPHSSAIEISPHSGVQSRLISDVFRLETVENIRTTAFTAFLVQSTLNDRDVEYVVVWLNNPVEREMQFKSETEDTDARHDSREESSTTPRRKRGFGLGDILT
ncbi:hypothetical protein V1512DRAFT_247151 [Lipomyces arxii]|uniref:uncharacterized protein n=1 Tax=Lipomyces arxii TaxID=56418 RepID=UPI0034CEFB06